MTMSGLVLSKKNVIFSTYEEVAGKSYSLEISFTVCQKYSIMMLD